jgi:DNA-3-methyladenine glycosylase I
VVPRAAILYAQGSSGVLARSLRKGGWMLDVVPASRLDAHADALDGYQSVVLDDVAVTDASPRFWKALAAAVQNRGLGLMVLGGERAFARGGYRDSALESVLPVLSEPSALDQPASILFVVDKSGSMGQGSAGVNRFQLAQRAVLETARGLTERDSLGLIVFDVAPRVLIPLGPAAAGAATLEQDWNATPNGGTRLAPALEAAIAELERSRGTRRMLVLVTDGFIDDASLAELRARLERARIETIALAVGPDGLARCWWGTSAPEYVEYHDDEWGRVLHGDDALYERLCLEAFQSGLSWLTILRKRPAFRSAFDGFVIDRVATFGDKDVERLMADASIVRNRAKIEAAINNARVAADQDVGLDELLWSFAPTVHRPRPAASADFVAITAESTAMAKELKRRGFRFFGPTTAYALMQATGMVDDHVAGCWRADQA